MTAIPWPTLAASLGGASVIHPQRQKRAQDAPAIHREGRDHVKKHEPDVDREQAHGQRHAGLLHHLRVGNPTR